MYHFLAKFFICKLLLCVVLNPYNGTLAIYPENKTNQDGSVELKTRKAQYAPSQNKVRWSKEFENSTKLKKKYSNNEAKKVKKVKRKDVQKKQPPPPPPPVDASKGQQSVLNELKETLLVRPQIIETMLKNLEETLLDNKLIAESKLNEVKEVLSDSDQMEKKNVLKVLKENLLSNPSIRNLMLKELEDILLGNELNTEFILNVLNKNKFSNRMAYLSLLNIFGRVIVSKKLMEESKLKELKGVLLGNNPITEPQLHDLKVLLVDILYNISNSNNKVETKTGDIINNVPEIDAYYFSQSFDSPTNIDMRYPNNLLQNVGSIKNNNYVSKRESFNREQFIRKNNLKRRDNLSLKHGSLKKKDLNYKKSVLQKDDLVKENNLLKQKFLKKEDFIQSRRTINRNNLKQKGDSTVSVDMRHKKTLLQKDISVDRDNLIQREFLKKDDFIRTSNLKRKTFFPPKFDDSIDDTPAIDRREILQKNHLIKKIDIKDIKKSTPKSDSLEKIDVEITPKDKLPKSDLADKIDKTKVEQITKKKQWTIEIHMSQKKEKDETKTKKKKKTTTISTHMCEKTKKSELIDIADSKSKDDKIGEEKVAKGKKFIVDIHMDKKKKKKPIIKRKPLVIEAIMENVFPKKDLEMLRKLYGSNVIDVDVRDPVYQATEEALFENVLATVRKKPSRKVQILRKLGIYGVVPALAIGTIIGFTIGYIHVKDVDILLDSVGEAAKTIVQKTVENAPKITNEVRTCITGIVDNAASSNSIGSFLWNAVLTVAKCATNTVIETVAVVADATFDGSIAGTAYGTSYGVMQVMFPALIALGVAILIYIFYRIIVYLDKKGKLEWYHRYERRFIKYVKKKYNEFRMSKKKK